VLVPSVPVHNDDLLATVAPHFVGSLLQKIELHARAVRNCTGLMTGFENLSEVVIWKYDCVLLPCACSER
jgi:hypothetical protein